MQIHFAVCDDNEADVKYIHSLVMQWAEASGHMAQVDTFSSAEAFLFHYEDEKDYDILLLDVEMGGINGVDLAKKVRRGDETVQIVFITGYSDYIAEGYEVAALHYLVKPLCEEKFTAVLNRAVEKLRRNARTLLLEGPEGMARIPFYEIRYVEVRQNYVTVHAKEDYMVKRTLSDLERELDDSFCRTGRSFIVNLARVRRVTRTEVHMDDGTAVPLSRGMYEKVNRAIISRM